MGGEAASMDIAGGQRAFRSRAGVDGDVGMVLEDPAHGLGDVGGVQARGGHLIEEGLEDVMVAPVDDRHVHGLASEAAGGIRLYRICLRHVWQRGRRQP